VSRLVPGTAKGGGTATGLAALGPPRSLTQMLIERLSAQITAGELKPGAQLPTEPELIAATGVSRTVVREAVAALRAEGLVVTRQGVGAFVAETPRRPFRIETGDLQSLRDVIQVMELRTGVEVEAAGLAAEFDAIAAAVARGDAAVDQDFAFHCRIADATGNPQFVRFLDYLGRFIIPRQTIRISVGSAPERRAYLERIQAEHRDILRAVRERAPTRARAAMRAHLANSRKRYQKLAEELERNAES